MGENKKTLKKVIVIIASLLIFALAITIYWFATENDRLRKKNIEYIQEQIVEFRKESSPKVWDNHFSIYIRDELMEDAEFQEYLVGQIHEMYQNNELVLMHVFVQELVLEEFYCSAVKDAINECLMSSESIEDALSLIDALNSDRLKYYQLTSALNRSSGVIATYIENHGTNAITYSPGKGYYANKNDSTSKKVIGLPDSPLYDAVSSTYLGDFCCYHEFGVKLNNYYEETPYSDKKYYFRDTYIPFAPNDGECVWSGDYLFCFSPAGDLINYVNVK